MLSTGAGSKGQGVGERGMVRGGDEKDEGWREGMMVRSGKRRERVLPVKVHLYFHTGVTAI